MSADSLTSTPTSSSSRRRAAIAAALLLCLALGWGLSANNGAHGLFVSTVSAASTSAPRVGGNAAGLPWWVCRYRAAIPAATYSAIVISPRPTHAADQGNSVQFVIRAEDARGNVEDFAFHVPSGKTLVIPFAELVGAGGGGVGGWTPIGEAILYAPDNGVFAAWGVTSQGLVRFEPVERDPEEAAAERERRRDLDQFRRERMRAE